MDGTGDRSWGHLARSERYGRHSKNFCVIPKSDLQLPKYRDCKQGGHCMLYAASNEKIFGIYAERAVVLMQMRFDGYLGFPGGLINSGEGILHGLNRELAEEMNVDLSKVSVTEDDYIVSHWCSDLNLTLHFYAHKVSTEEIRHIEKMVLEARDYGSEVLGVVRVPLYTMGDGFRGFPAFLTNSFVGNARHQLLTALERLSIMTANEISMAESAKASPASS